MVRLKFSIELTYTVLDSSCDFLFNIHPAITANQYVVSESVSINQSVPYQVSIRQDDGTRWMKVRAYSGDLVIRYEGVLDIHHTVSWPGGLQEMAVADLPMDLFCYIYPSRYCESDRFQALANHEFGNMQPGYSRVLAIRDWVYERTRYTSGSSGSSTSAVDTLTDHVGVCRDFAHLMISTCRALNMPARFVSGINYGADPALGDFHAYVEVFLSGRWYLFDPSGVSPTMGLLRLGTGRDAADVSFATVFGAAVCATPMIAIEAIEDLENGVVLPIHQTNALSTAGSPATQYHRVS
ncbi:transglutaminase family protein [uncultured Halopseudomonas sp.]|jgi:transglutaminase-like putative cysteine protease|uniref:transglutaminase-like domain-containing protein n=1 Tax=uncultured Halopseudomonas sp. TaxID=2901193 RepID=UPI0030EE6BD6|tara:strand:- start:102584 stop:103471 length:888 start_codon:yes stop_codon:yes gene_type:complete